MHNLNGLENCFFMFQDVVEYFSTLFKNDFASYRDILTGLPDLYVVTMAAVNKKIRPSDFAKMVKSLQTVSDKLNRLTTNSVLDAIKLRPRLLSNILASMSTSFVDLNQLVESVDLDSAAKNVFESLFSDISTFPGISEKKLEIERLTSKLNDHKTEICRKLGLFSFSYTSVSGMDFLVEVSPPSKKVPNDWTRYDHFNCSQLHLRFSFFKYLINQ